MSTYFMAQIAVHDKAEYEHYLDGFDEIFAEYDGEVVAVDDNPKVLEGAWPYTRIVLIRFATEAEAERWYHSPEYQKLARHRQRASKADILLVQGRD